MTSQWQAQKSEVAETARRMAEQALLPSAAGNISVRLEPRDGRELMAITPLGRQNAGLTDDDVVVVYFDVEPV